MEKVVLNIYNIVGNSLCVEADDGQKVYILIKKALESDKKVILSFQNIEMLTTAFLNNAIGQLYRDFEENKIKESLSVEHITPGFAVSIKRVTSTAKPFYNDPERMKNSIDEILGEGD